MKRTKRYSLFKVSILSVPPLSVNGINFPSMIDAFQSKSQLILLRGISNLIPTV